MSHNWCVDMFTHCTHPSVKDSIIASISNAESVLRILICTVAFGMGINTQGVRQVLHWGPSSDVESLDVGVEMDYDVMQFCIIKTQNSLLRLHHHSCRSIARMSLSEKAFVERLWRCWWTMCWRFMLWCLQSRMYYEHAIIIHECIQTLECIHTSSCHWKLSVQCRYSHKVEEMLVDSQLMYFCSSRCEYAVPKCCMVSV